MPFHIAITYIYCWLVISQHIKHYSIINIHKRPSSIAPTSCTSKSLKTSTALAPACSAELTACAQLCTWNAARPTRPRFGARGRPKKRGKLAEILGKCQETAEKCGKTWWTNGNTCWEWEKWMLEKLGKDRNILEKSGEDEKSIWKMLGNLAILENLGLLKKGWDFVLVGCFRRNI